MRQQGRPCGPGRRWNRPQGRRCAGPGGARVARAAGACTKEETRFCSSAEAVGIMGPSAAGAGAAAASGATASGAAPVPESSACLAARLASRLEERAIMTGDGGVAARNRPPVKHGGRATSADVGNSSRSCAARRGSIAW